ncbi:helix-turn-helix domain-containing protein [Desertivirga arenae]|uniref:helix-turn-helix domain-containing protein n=1 Tax=Desertivirga arenae TaxID=2810309 RepID=UPI001A97C5FD|nr:helix-turn-helix transcriptional regulator [Pedobacter sp. SYSU D00823]
METSSKPAHIGRKISRIRELRNMKQDSLAFELGVSQQTVSRMEASETVDDEMLEKVAKVLGVNKEVIKNFSEEAVFNIIGNTVNNHDNGSLFNYYPTFNPLDKLMEAIEENKSLYEENKKLYERLLQSEKEKVEILMKSNSKP